MWIPARQFVKREYALMISREGSAIVFRASNSTYLLIPSQIKQTMQDIWGINFKDKAVRVKCDMVTDNTGELHLIYTFTKEDNRLAVPENEEAKEVTQVE